MLLKDNTQRAKQAQTIFYVVIGTLILSVLSSAYQYNLISRIEIGDYNETEVTLSDTLDTVITLFGIVVRIITVVLFLNWLRRAYGNLSRAGLKHVDDERKAVWAWFIPFMNFVTPYKIVKEIYTETKRLITPKGERYKLDPSTSILVFWWATLIISGVVGNIATRLLNGNTIKDIKSGILFYGISDIIEIIPAILCILIIKRISADEQTLLRMEEAMLVEKQQDSSNENLVSE